MIVDSRGYPMAIGRLYITPDCEGQIRYMAVKANRRSKGMGSLILVALESLARQEGAKRLVCNAREDAIPFYAKNGFERRGELTDERGPVRHQQMVKTLDPMANVLRKPEWCTELQDRWASIFRSAIRWGSRSSNTRATNSSAARSLIRISTHITLYLLVRRLPSPP